MSDSGRPEIDTITKRLPNVNRAPLMAREAKRNPDFVERVVFQGFNDLIERFNAMNDDDPNQELLPDVMTLKQKLGSAKLPTIAELGKKDLIRGLRAANKFIEIGQDIKKGKLPEKLKGAAIMSPSAETNTQSLIVGTAAHILERALFTRLQTEGFDQWMKDEILFALEDLILLQHAEALAGNGEDSPLFHIVTSPHSLGPEGGIGWRKQEQVDEFVKKYNDHHQDEDS
ncbi:hypothetical protein A3G67_04420 [Candidatus Roizmanbacteria bacterium RIFCSPLOWO2_12_FULL_40_12]|uniref:Uncharacterized protein n=1 Tax=Candidatus Roizmanbacteria bacterium RIFCSPLOWO2_01_FULL_40_42 TaxID=1802066 RepID=A0A1F7J4S3_9BACT|nr:MAG: hypothetical protein A2779_04730 [Candidatus Roizmanbacteria bacterium RIFCSPHIGHO2_01_FULL_40_98]OGK27378.1 MAG: hypothetical protein A3C31_05055 [Candidatus Roizmanbacteria bacterium RIFCSPHIGHO2_02_FULL_40_53]OGK30750.1 MAG: hypothetical protein A2W49_01985 [Candidatus Roizmanbacteria bacterium RIFCSPHIGHO2_12_41_18]OGK36483.1 MAG: hypothetical protein A3E69_02680 [Candidatus Roizmanbacteria bacterium RIFCSPHIGHO2_12_FULL_40_130]OGK50611.1 MAG: hypothetical protein A3B50_02410 [Candi